MHWEGYTINPIAHHHHHHQHQQQQASKLRLLQGVAYRHVILLVLSRKFPKMQARKPRKFAVVDNPTVI